MVVGDKKSYGIVRGSGGILPQKIFVFFYPYSTAFHAFSERDFWIYSVALYRR